MKRQKKPLTKLFIDDLRTPKQGEYVIIRSYPEAIGWMRKHGCPQFISFDHDLGSTSDHNGYDIAKWMVNVDLDNDGTWIPDDFEYHVHSANPVGAANITGIFESYLNERRKRKNSGINTK